MRPGRGAYTSMGYILLMTTRVRQYVRGDIAEGTSVVIFGAGDVAELVHYALLGEGLTTEFFCDPLAESSGATLLGIPVRSASVLPTVSLDTPVFDAWDYRRYARQPELLSQQANVYVASALLAQSDLDEAAVTVPHRQRALRVIHYAAQCAAIPELSGADGLELRSLDVVVTEVCTMKCKDCSNLMQYYARPGHSDVDELLDSIDKLMAATDGITEFRVLGGEPFANPRVGRVIRHLAALTPERVIVFTNGTIVPRPDLLHDLQETGTVVRITNYGDLSKRHDELCSVLEDAGVSWLSQVPIWTDSGRLVTASRTHEELQQTFRDCCVRDLLTLLNGVLYRCPFSANAINLGAVAAPARDMVRLADFSDPRELRAAVHALYTRTDALEACRSCNGRDHTTPEIEAALQVRRALPFVPVETLSVPR